MTITAAAPGRQEFTTDRANDFLTITDLTKLTGTGWARFPEVVAKELMDNALDATETTVDRSPHIDVTVAATGDRLSTTVTDNGPGFPAASIGKIMDFTTRTSSKAKVSDADQRAAGKRPDDDHRHRRSVGWAPGDHRIHGNSAHPVRPPRRGARRKVPRTDGRVARGSRRIRVDPGESVLPQQVSVISPDIARVRKTARSSKRSCTECRSISKRGG
jgi:hypothetical protein